MKAIKKNKNIDTKKLELLAPAGSLSKLKTAFNYGADAVYLGIPDFSLRVRINDFDMRSLAEGVKQAHAQGKKAYVTINIFAHNEHIRKLPKYLALLKKIGPDALIISDPGIIALAKKYLPKTEIHLSTQANCTNLESARFWTKQGVDRIILGREVSLREIKEIKKALPKVELEYFVHGAMCMAYSGRCFLSKLFVNRSGNLGDCAQPCRWEYNVSEFRLKADRHEEELELVQEKHGSYLLNSNDLNLVRYLQELIKAGVTSFKIEGRAKSDYYLATVCSIYRKALDLASSKMPKKKLEEELDYLHKELETKLVHRGYTTGFLLNEKAGQNINDSRNESSWEYCGQVVKAEETEKNIIVYFRVHNTILANDNIELIFPSYEILKTKPKYFLETDIKGNITDKKILEAHGGGGAKVLGLVLERKDVNIYNIDNIFKGLVMRRFKGKKNEKKREKGKNEKKKNKE